MSRIDARICGIPCIIEVIHWQPAVPANLSGHPDNWSPPEDSETEYEILDRNGRPAPWLENKMTAKDYRLLEEHIDQVMADLADDF